MKTMFGLILGRSFTAGSLAPAPAGPGHSGITQRGGTCSGSAQAGVAPLPKGGQTAGFTATGTAFSSPATGSAGVTGTPDSASGTHTGSRTTTNNGNGTATVSLPR